MRLLWLRKGDFSGADRALLEANPEILIEYAHHPDEIPGLLSAATFDVAFASGQWSRDELLAALWHLQEAQVPMVEWLAGASVEETAALVKAGVYAVLPPDATVASLREALDRAANDVAIDRASRAAASASKSSWRDALVGRSRAMFAVCNLVELVGHRRCTVLVTGETGTGKEMIARAIHQAGQRSQKPWVAVNCSALPDTLLEAELFGHTKGAFTGAVGARTGRFEEAHQGTIFLDEIGDMPIDLQAKLLRVLQEREIQRIGSSQTIPVDVRVVAATNVDLAVKVREGKFREDLFYRLNVVPIHIPPLRERMSDVPLLAQTFVEKICRYEDIPRKRILQEAMHHLCTYHWPGNVRQLENLMEMAVVLSGGREVLLPGDFRLPSRSIGPARSEAEASGGAPRLPEDGLDFEAAVSALERALLMQALDRSKGNKRMAAELLRLKRTTLTAKIKSLELAS
ncbi:MAG: sigma-54 dependent transcriptional regulator [Bryobacterales bacterium]|nr:sigma-54 dependent transcriptional regulator [Bryobacterales bacterium]